MDVILIKSALDHASGEKVGVSKMRAYVLMKNGIAEKDPDFMKAMESEAQKDGERAETAKKTAPKAKLDSR